MERIYSDKLDLYRRWLHHSMSAVGGFMAAYAILSFGNSGNAQTFNLVALAMAIVGKNVSEVLLRLVGFVIYILGTLLFVVVDHHHAPVQWLSLGLTSLVAVFCSAVDMTSFGVIGLYPFFFAMSFQRNCFLGTEKYSAATIFSSNNTRMFALSIGDYFYSKDRHQIDRALFFFGALLFFDIGAALCTMFYMTFGHETILFSFILLVIAGIIIYLQDKEEAFLRADR